VPRTRLRNLIVLLTLIQLAGMSGCGLFKPRDPDPGGGGASDCLTPNAPDNALTNVVRHYGIVTGITCYSSMLDSSFAFHPDVTDSIEALPGIFSGWNRDVETTDAANVAGDSTFSVASLDSQYAVAVLSPDQRTLTRFYAYHLIAHSSKPDTLYRGHADLTLFQSGNGEWHITTWVDHRDGSGARTWGYLRSLYRVGF
jgi:hypothetical protein